LIERIAAAFEWRWSPLAAALVCVALSVWGWLQIDHHPGFLGIGIFASAMIGLLIWSARLARRRARTLFETNAALAQILDEARAELSAERDSHHSIELEVARQTQELREAVTELDAFNASISHDLRSPIGAIVNFASLLRATQHERLDDVGLNFLTRIESAAQRALAKMEGLLSFSRVGRQPLNRAPIDLSALARRIHTDVRVRRPGTSFELSVQPLPKVSADPALVEALLRQLLDNAAKFSASQDKPQIELGSEPHADTDCVAYYVRDNGVGFDPAFADRLFRLFERLHRSEEFEGTGVGLAIAGRVVRRHGGRIWAESSPGQGATFFFTLEGVDDEERKLRGERPPSGG